MTYYPITLNLENRRCLVVGGGPVAQRKVAELLAAGARVVVIAPQVTADLRQWADDGCLEWRTRLAEADDVAGAILVIAATDDPASNALIWEASRAHGALVNAVDDLPHCDFIAPAIVRRGQVTIAISTGGNSPALAAHLRRYLEGAVGPEYGLLAELLGSLRKRVMAELPDPGQRAALWQSLVESDLLEVLRRSESEGDAALEQARSKAEKLVLEFINHER
ncbi:MAG: bifunctional precorrin-2 dehydrogenase/sirohydrochlorin ferrochelatase [Anaerolineae bacterium]